MAAHCRKRANSLSQRSPLPLDTQISAPRNVTFCLRDEFFADEGKGWHSRVLVSTTLSKKRRHPTSRSLLRHDS